MHDHDHFPADSSDSRQKKRALKTVLVITVFFTGVEIVGGVLTGSLALLADAGHMLSDNMSLALALFAVWLADRPPSSTRSFGYKRAEILAALVNGVALVVVAGWIFYEAIQRLSDPPDVLGGWMLLVACIGLGANIVGAVILYRSQGESLNVKAAFRHVLGDLAGSVGAIIAAVIIITSGWLYADPIIGMLIGVLVLASSWLILKESLRILLEATPTDIDSSDVGQNMVLVEGVEDVHDLHIWTITSGFPALTAHVLVGRDCDCHQLRRGLEKLLLTKYGVRHTTLQVDHVHDENNLVDADGLKDPGREKSA